MARALLLVFLLTAAFADVPWEVGTEAADAKRTASGLWMFVEAWLQNFGHDSFRPGDCCICQLVVLVVMSNVCLPFGLVGQGQDKRGYACQPDACYGADVYTQKRFAIIGTFNYKCPKSQKALRSDKLIDLDLHMPRVVVVPGAVTSVIIVGFQAV